MAHALDDYRACAELGVEQSLALAYVPHGAREAVASLWQLDARLRGIFLTTREAALAEIKLAWWEERLRALHTDAVPPEPLLRQLAAVTTIEASDLSDIAGGWRALFAGEGTADDLGNHSRQRGRGLVRAAAAALEGQVTEPMLLAGEGYALVDLAGSRSDYAARRAALSAARGRFGQAGHIIWPRPLRPIGMIVKLARADAARGQPGRAGSPPRVARMAWHALTGR